jgi:hypothetical protein
MATYCVTYSEADDWGQAEDRFKTRPPADNRLEEARARGQFARMNRWENRTPTEVARVNEHAAPPDL